MFKIGEVTRQWAQSKQISVLYFAQTESTNLIAKNSSAQKGFELVLTDDQVSGRGRGSNIWKTPGSGNSLLSSWVYDLDQPPRPTLTCLAGLAVYRALMASWPQLSLSVKPPNDIYLDGKKLAGLLIENIQEGSHNKVIIGLGLNVFAKPELATACCLQDSISELNASDWSEFMARLSLEFQLAVEKAFQPLALNDQRSLLFALNAYPELNEPYIQLEADGSLVQKSRRISWFDL